MEKDEIDQNMLETRWKMKDLRGNLPRGSVKDKHEET